MEPFAKIVNGYNYFRNFNFSRSLLYEINITTSDKGFNRSNCEQNIKLGMEHT